MVGSRQVRVNFWDMAGGAEYYEVRREFYSDAQGCLLVFDVCAQASFERLDGWLQEARGQGAPAGMCIAVCANKVDHTRRRVVSEADGRRWASQHGAMYAETSALDGSGVAGMFDALFREICRRGTGG
mmetsp:Transcript_27526/g.91534  ORF Transcript_27526/g.91534 Transcript_27526/m.91534 type:complete len:128 (+) Transcript_27526:254-637(+)